MDTIGLKRTRVTKEPLSLFTLYALVSLVGVILSVPAVMLYWVICEWHPTAVVAMLLVVVPFLVHMWKDVRGPF